MVAGEGKTLPIQILVNYWECRPSLIGARLDELYRQGITHVTSFVPWQAVESDISHTLLRFLTALADRNMKVSLILTPEVGVHYPNSGLPKDVVSRPDGLAQHSRGATLSVVLPPNAFHMPSLAAPEFNKRYHNFLTRIDNLLADVCRTQPKVANIATLVLTGSFWKYMRAPQFSASNPFGGAAGDYSACASVAFRQRMEQFFGQREFMVPTPAAANRWKTQALEPVNRRWFNQHMEDVFRSRSLQFVRRKAADLGVRQMELFTPEADPGYCYSNFLQAVCGTNGDFSRLSSLVDEAATRASFAGEAATHSYIHWSGLGGFKTLSDSEKQFLILKSLLLMGGVGGGVLIDESEWFALSQVFRTRAEGLSRSLINGDLKLPNGVLYLSPHLWSTGGTIWDELNSAIGPSARVVSSVDYVLQDRDARLVVVDPMFVFTRETVQKLLGWAKAGRVVALPRSTLYTEDARSELEGVMGQTNADRAAAKAMMINVGIPYRLQPSGNGRVILFELPEGLNTQGEAHAAWKTFLASVLSVAGVARHCDTSDGRLRLIPLQKKDGGLGLFIMNGSNQKVTADVLFGTEVTVSDLSTYFAVQRSGSQEFVPPARRFTLEVPPCGILPLSVEGLQDVEERKAAAVTAEVLKQSVLEAAASELPGFFSAGDVEATWS